MKADSIVKAICLNSYIRSIHGPWLLKPKVQMNLDHTFVIRDWVKIY